MNALKTTLIALIIVGPSSVEAQEVVPTMDRQFDVCADRPVEPEWMGELPARDNYKRLVIQSIYELQSHQAVAEAGECSCATRFLSWDAAVAHFNDNYLGQDRNGLREVRDDYRAEANELRPSVRPICEAAGNW